VLIEGKVWDTDLRRYGLVFDFIPDVETLESKLEEPPNGRLAEHDAKKIFKQIMQVAAHMHQTEATPLSPVLHRGLKPENILVKPDLKAYVINWSTSTRQFYTSPHGAVQACDYVAPEYTRGGGDLVADNLDQKVDVWSCGVMLYRMVCGRLPFSAGASNLADLARRVANEDVTFPEDQDNPISHDCRDLINKMLEKDRNDRITSAAVLAHRWLADPPDDLPDRDDDDFLDYEI